ncbi:hypothetical protein [Bradyrhizobium sp. CCGUVB23]|uniref:hypothetical protein n=1 Tax=Bradyrhizobium sp. CCGUVB23 TaxID=2949630 RepID=UPI0020B2B746|nr:hypothetical protein [Bradyrhizobium sp. CCGUVB23]MCP3460621.1 hypothetical protein [Bradyrhizobium sp. CCGUVB23]
MYDLEQVMEVSGEANVSKESKDRQCPTVFMFTPDDAIKIQTPSPENAIADFL